MEILKLENFKTTKVGVSFDMTYKTGLFRKKEITRRVFIKKIGESYSSFAEWINNGVNTPCSTHVASVALHELELIEGKFS